MVPGRYGHQTERGVTWVGRGRVRSRDLEEVEKRVGLRFVTRVAFED